MTIRLHCMECQRKLKVPDEALGKKVQCPVCGARFIGRIESTPPPVAADPPTEIPLVRPPAEMTPSASAEVPASTLALADAPLVDSIFAEMTSPLVDETIAASASPLPPITPLTSLPDPSREDALMEAEAAENEPLEPVVMDAAVAEMIEHEAGIEFVEEAVEDASAAEVVEEAVEEEMVVEEAVEEEEVEVLDAADDEPMRTPKGSLKSKKPARRNAEEPEVVEEDSPARSGQAQKGKKSRKGWFWS